MSVAVPPTVIVPSESTSTVGRANDCTAGTAPPNDGSTVPSARSFHIRGGPGSAARPGPAVEVQRSVYGRGNRGDAVYAWENQLRPRRHPRRREPVQRRGPAPGRFGLVDSGRDDGAIRENGNVVQPRDGAGGRARDLHQCHSVGRVDRIDHHRVNVGSDEQEH